MNLRTATRRSFLFGLPVLVAFGIPFGPRLVDAVTSGDRGMDPVAVTSDDPTFVTVGDLVAASDAVVLAEVVESADGRSITDPSQPDAGIRTRLAGLRVVEVLAGAAPDRLVLEEAATLLDGTPLAVDGARPVVSGDRGVFFLVSGGSEASPHWAVVGRQGRYLVRGDRVEAAGDDPLSLAVESAGGPALVDAVVASVPGQVSP